MLNSNLIMIGFFVLAFCTKTIAQQKQFYYNDFFYFIKEVDVRNMSAKKIHFAISVKSNPADSFSCVKIYAAQKRKGREDFIDSTLKYATVSGKDWQVYTVDEDINRSAKTIWLYCAVNGNGNFYFDDLKIYSEEENGLLLLVETENPSFEIKNILKGYMSGKTASKGVSYVGEKKIKTDGKQSLHIKVANQKPVN